LDCTKIKIGRQGKSEGLPKKWVGPRHGGRAVLGKKVSRCGKKVLKIRKLPKFSGKIPE
jgi:hypothetical protein